MPNDCTKQQLAKVNIDHILIGDWVIRQKGVVKNLWKWLYSTLSVNSHVNNTNVPMLFITCII